MPPRWVFLHRDVYFVDGEFNGGAGNAIGGGPYASLQEVAAALKPNPVVADPPEVTSLSMVRHLPSKDLMPGEDSGTVSSTDKGLVVIYSGRYRPGDDGESGCCYLVYDASTSSLSAIPQLDPPMSRPELPPTFSIRCLGTSAAILRLRHADDGGAGAYVLAELVTSYYPGLPDAHLYLWRSASSNPEWMMRTSARLPLPDELTSFFHIDMAFAFGDSFVCWADLLAGVLICDLFAPQGPKFSFVPLPQQCCSYTRVGLGPEQSRSMGVICGAIKLVALVGNNDECLPKQELVLKTWTLSSDFNEWKEGSAVLVRHLWETESFRKMELPRVRPMNPVLSMDEDEVVYISLNDIESVDRFDSYIQQIVGKDLLLRGHHVLRLDLLQNKVLYSKKSAANSLGPFALQISADFGWFRLICCERKTL